ncbi:hypothetical protein [Nocardioides sp. Root140]|uniref:hypothetical protein n=1 Tax=Nocardioides sp. Root140 TaxID=1736460 RepID=UPI0006FF1A61|nr:hypothetical protein [Nocardioides sp. Root140]KQY51567.1 hypothetical protein ASD30_19545 [Nocardioides sp. Root140]
MNIDNLPDKVRSSLLRGYVEKSWRMPWLAVDYAHLVDVPVEDAQAYEDGLGLRGCLDSIFSADMVSELRSDERRYDALAGELNERYGEGLVVLSAEPGDPGLRGFRVSPFSTETTTVRNPDGTLAESVRDLEAEVEAQNQTDRKN